MKSLAAIKLENKRLKEQIERYEKITASALTDYQNKQILEDRHREAVAEIKALESKTRSIAQQIRRETEKQDKLRGQLEDCKLKLVSRWEGVFNG